MFGRVLAISQMIDILFQVLIGNFRPIRILLSSAFYLVIFHLKQLVVTWLMKHSPTVNYYKLLKVEYMQIFLSVLILYRLLLLSSLAVSCFLSAKLKLNLTQYRKIREKKLTNFCSKKPYRRVKEE